MKKKHFGSDDIGKVITHGLGIKMTIVSLDPRSSHDSFYSSDFAYCRYKNDMNGSLEVHSFHASEFEFPKEEEKEDE
jgi:hypothetical protein